MKYERFEQLPVWQAAIEFAVEIYALTAKPVFRRHRSLRDQVERAAVSVSNNIAEGFERGTNNELLSFLYIARGSAGEVRSMLHLLGRMPAFCDLESEIRDLMARAESVSKQLGAWIQSLQNSGLKGQRYVTEKTRRASASAEDRRRFLSELQQIQAAHKAQGGESTKM
ncbi:MAG: four helix bundle protein [Acidobacteriia bacterium]|nr:four helix bundle protein [Terriglobia bacterium]